MTTGHPQQERACPAWQMRLEAFVDGELSPADADVMRTHLRGCAACLAEVKALAELSQEFRGLSDARAPERLWHQIETQLDLRPARALQRPQTASRRLSRRTALTATAAAALLAVGTYAVLPAGNAVVTAAVNDFITYRAKGWTVDYAASDAGSLAAWAQSRVTFAVPELKQRFGAFEAGGIRLCWLLNRRLLGLTYASGEDRAVVYVMEARGLALPTPDRLLANGTRASVQQVKGHGVAVWTESDLVFVLVAAEKDFARALQFADQRAGMARPDTDTS